MLTRPSSPWEEMEGPSAGKCPQLVSHCFLPQSHRIQMWPPQIPACPSRGRSDCATQHAWKVTIVSTIIYKTVSHFWLQTPFPLGIKLIQQGFVNPHGIQKQNHSLTYLFSGPIMPKNLCAVFGVLENSWFKDISCLMKFSWNLIH